MNICLESVNDQNAGDLVQSGEDVGVPGFFPVPYDEAGAQRVLSRAIIAREEHSGDIFAAYDIGPERLFVGSGEVSHQGGELSFANWVVASLRRQGYGKALRTSLEERARAADMFPDAHTMVAHVHFLNLAATAFAESLGYEPTDDTKFGQLVVYRKRLHPQ